MSLSASTLFLNAIQRITAGDVKGIDAPALAAAINALPPQDAQKKKAALLALAVSSPHQGVVALFAANDLLPLFVEGLRLDANTFATLHPVNAPCVARILHEDVSKARKNPKASAPMLRQLRRIADDNPKVAQALRDMGLTPQADPAGDAPFSFSFFQPKTGKSPAAIAETLAT